MDELGSQEFGLGSFEEDTGELPGDQDQSIQQLEAFTAELQPVSPLARTDWSTWNKRGNSWNQSFIRLRPTLLQADLMRQAMPEVTGCDTCGSDIAHILCLDCGFPEGTLLCGGCDRAAHPYAHLHRRQHMVNSRLVPMHPLKNIDAIGNVMRRGEPLQPCVCNSFSMHAVAQVAKKEGTVHQLVHVVKFHCARMGSNTEELCIGCVMQGCVLMYARCLVCHVDQRTLKGLRLQLRA